MTNLRPTARIHRRGNYSMLAALMLPVVMGFGALALDTSYIRMSQTQAQLVANAASHAAFVHYRKTGDADDARKAAQAVVDANDVGFETATLRWAKLGEWADETGTFVESAGDGDYLNAAEVSLGRYDDNTLDLLLAPVLGFMNRDINATAVTMGRTREIMIVQDVTESFTDDIDDARDASLELLDFMVNAPYPGDRLGMSVYVGDALPDVFQPLASLDASRDDIEASFTSLDACSSADDSDDNPYAGCPSWMSAATEAACESNPSFNWAYDPGEPGTCWQQFNEMTDFSMCVFEPVGSAVPGCVAETAPHTGIYQATDEFVANGDPHAFQAMVVISDGVPCCGDETLTNELAALDAADNAWDEHGIHIWSLAYDNPDEPGDVQFMAELVRGMGKAYTTTDSGELEDMLLEIMQSIPTVLVE